MAKLFKTLGLQALIAVALLAGSPAAHAFEPFIGEVRWVGFNFAPRGWALCDGQLLSIAQNTALFAIIGTIYGGDGRTTFGLPDMRGRAMMHAGRGPGLSNRPLGQRSGAERHTLTVSQMPAHSHTLNAGDRADDVKPDDRKLADTGRFRMFNTSPSGEEPMSPQSLGNTGGNQAHNNMQPFVTAYCIIALQGVFPSRS